jgi:hypothetical protein
MAADAVTNLIKLAAGALDVKGVKILLLPW